jgi:hypothetical protein
MAASPVIAAACPARKRRSYKRGAARRVAQSGRRCPDLDRASSPPRDWVKSRIQLERGKIADLQGRRADATHAYREAVRLSISGNDDDTTDQAKRLLKSPYRSCRVRESPQLLGWRHHF